MKTKTEFHYFYKITNILNNHFYYGVHNTNNLNDGYMGSGKRLHIAYKKYGIENFRKEILKFFNTSLEAFEYEAEIVNEVLVKDPNCYNICMGGKVGTTNMVVVKDIDNNIFTVLKDDPRYLSGELVGITKGISNYSHIGHTTAKDKDGNFYFVSIDDPRYLSGELVHLSTDTVTVKDSTGNFFRVSINDPRYKAGELTTVWKGRKHTEEFKEKVKKTFKSIGHQQGKKNSQFGKVWIYNEIEKISKSIPKEELQYYIDLGWKKGRKLKWNIGV